MRIAILSPYTDPVKGGISSYTRELMSAYRNLGIETLGIAQAGVTNLYFEVIRGTKIGFCIKSAFRILRWKAEVVHGHSHWPELLPGLALKVLRPRTRVLFTFHTPPVDPDEREGALRRARRQMFLTLVRLCDGVAFVSRDAEAAVNLPAFVPHGVVHAAPERSAEAIDPPVADPAKRRVVLAVSMLTWPKKVEGLLLLLDAFGAIAAAFPEWQLVIAGDGPLRGRVQERIASLHLQGRVRLVGFVNDVPGAMANAGVYAHISLLEGLPLALLTAMSLGLPAIATRVGGIPDVIDDRVTGILVNPSRSDLSNALTELFGDPELRGRIGEAARTWTAQELTWEKVARRSLGIIGMTPR